MFGYDDENNIVRDVEEEERKKAVINIAVQEAMVIQSINGCWSFPSVTC